MRMHVCEQCGFVATHHAGLSSHRRNAHKVKPKVKPEPKRQREVIMRAGIVVKLVCPFCRKQFTRRSWFDTHECEEKRKLGVSQHRYTLPWTERTHLHYLVHDGVYTTFITYHEQRDDALAEFAAEVEVMKANGKRPAQIVTSRVVVADMIEAGYQSSGNEA